MPELPEIKDYRVIFNIEQWSPNIIGSAASPFSAPISTDVNVSRELYLLAYNNYKRLKNWILASGLQEVFKQ